MDNHKGVIIFLPWLRSDQTVQVCNIRFIPLRDALESKKTNVDLVRHIDAIIEQYRLDPYSSEKDALVCASVPDPFSLENEEQFDRIQEASKVFAICSISENEYFRASTRYVNSSCFELVGQRFVLGDYHSAFISRRRDGSTKDAGYPYNTILTNAPPWVRQCKGLLVYEGLVKAIEKLREKDKSEYNRFLLAFEWFLASATDNPSVSSYFEAVALTAAFDQSHQSNMNPNHLYRIFTADESRRKNVWENNIKSKWYKEFRDKRNATIHGSIRRNVDKEDLFLDLFVASQLLYALWKRQFMLLDCYRLTEEDIETEYRIDELIDTKDYNTWNDRLRAARRRALKEHNLESQK